MEKNNNNNTHRYNDRYNLQTQSRTVLKGNYGNFLETFYENKTIAITPTNLYYAWSEELGIHENTVKNFIKSALSRGWIYQMKPIEGTRISNAYIDIKQPDYLSTGQIIHDKRFKYYRITQLGIQIFESNGLNLTQTRLL